MRSQDAPSTVLTSHGKVNVALEEGLQARGAANLYTATLSLTSGTDGGVWSTSRPGRFTPGRDPVTVVQEAR